MAEREGFEPPVPFDTLDFESSTLDHSDTSPSRNGVNPIKTDAPPQAFSAVRAYPGATRSSPLLKSPLTFRPRCQIRTFSRRQSRLNEGSATIGATATGANFQETWIIYPEKSGISLCSSGCAGAAGRRRCIASAARTPNRARGARILRAWANRRCWDPPALPDAG